MNYTYHYLLSCAWLMDSIHWCYAMCAGKKESSDQGQPGHWAARQGKHASLLRGRGSQIQAATQAAKAQEDGRRCVS